MNNDFHTLLSSITDFTCQNRTLTDQEKKLFDDFCIFFSKYRNRTIVYRGTELPLNDFTKRIEKLPDFLFILGDKAKTFKKNDMDPFSDVDFFPSKNASILFDIIHDIFCSPEKTFKHPNSKNKWMVFRDKNPNFVKYFIDSSSKDKFVDNLVKQHDVRAFDYYYAFIHTIGSNLQLGSSQLSSSTTLKQAEKFQKNGIMIVGWIPETKKGFQLKRENINMVNDELRKNGLPTYDISLYPEQNEICLKYGLLPHFIVGYRIKNTFVVNHNLINDLSSRRLYDDIIDNGIKIDQNNFKDILSRTALKHYYIVIDNYYYAI